MMNFYHFTIRPFQLAAIAALCFTSGLLLFELVSKLCGNRNPSVGFSRQLHGFKNKQLLRAGSINCRAVSGGNAILFSGRQRENPDHPDSHILSHATGGSRFTLRSMGGCQREKPCLAGRDKSSAWWSGYAKARKRIDCPRQANFGNSLFAVIYLNAGRIKSATRQEEVKQKSE